MCIAYGNPKRGASKTLSPIPKQTAIGHYIQLSSVWMNSWLRSRFAPLRCMRWLNMAWQYTGITRRLVIGPFQPESYYSGYVNLQIGSAICNYPLAAM